MSPLLIYFRHFVQDTTVMILPLFQSTLTVFPSSFPTHHHFHYHSTFVSTSTLPLSPLSSYHSLQWKYSTLETSTAPLFPMRHFTTAVYHRGSYRWFLWLTFVLTYSSQFTTLQPHTVYWCIKKPVHSYCHVRLALMSKTFHLFIMVSKMPHLPPMKELLWHIMCYGALKTDAAFYTIIITTAPLFDSVWFLIHMLLVDAAHHSHRLCSWKCSWKHPDQVSAQHRLGFKNIRWVMSLVGFFNYAIYKQFC